MEAALKILLVCVMVLSVLLFFVDIRKGYSQVSEDTEANNESWNDDWEEHALALKD